jgi:hypothetical protein
MENNNNISSVLREATKDILTEDVLKEIEAAFNSTVNERVQLHVEKALSEQDADYSKKLETLVEAIDTDHTDKLKKVVEAIDADRAEKLKTVVEKYETALNKEAAAFKSSMVDKVSKFLDLYIDEKLPTAAINEAVKNKRAVALLEDLRKVLSVDMILAKDNIRDAIVDGKTKIDEAASQLEAANKQVTKLTEENLKLTSKIVLEEKISNLDEDEKTYMKKMLNGKSAEFIKENFDYTLNLFEKTEEERLSNLKTEAVTESVSTTVDRPVIEEKVSEPVNEEKAPSFGLYMNELKKY